MDMLKLLDKRRHIRVFDTERVPSKDVIKECLHKAWKVTPSKANFMPYHVNVIGPENKELIDKIHGLSKFNKKRTNETANINNIKDFEEDGSNSNFDFYSTVPYLLVISQRVCEPNPYIAEQIKIHNDVYEQMYAEEFYNFQTCAAVEIGIFGAHATAFLLEKGIDTNYIKCYPYEMEKWKDFTFVEGPVMLIMGIGYCRTSRRDAMTLLDRANDYKPLPEEIIRFV